MLDPGKVDMTLGVDNIRIDTKGEDLERCLYKPLERVYITY
jgi:hypothetical protein